LPRIYFCQWGWARCPDGYPGITDPLSLIPIVLEAAKLYDEEHKRCDEDYQRARDHAEAAANFL